MEALSNKLKQYKNGILTAVLILLCAALCIEIIRDLSRGGDFKGYVNAGLLAWNKQDIYSDVYNTWPPFFSVFSIPLAWLDAISPMLNRFIWLVLSVVAFVATIDLSTKVLFNKRLLLHNTNKHSISIKNILIVIPVLLVFRYVLDNLSNIQINIFLLYGCLLSYYLFTQSKYIVSALILALIISLKVIPIFILFFFIYKGAWKVSAWTLFFIIGINALSLLYFGPVEGLQYYHTWLSDVAPKSYISNRSNQSIIGGLLRLLTNEDTTLPLKINLVHLPKQFVINLAYVIIGVIALIPAYIFRLRKNDNTPVLRILEFSFILTAIPVLSPLSWKAYFIFLWFPYFLLYYLIYHSEYVLDNSKRIKLLFISSVLLTTFSSDIFWGQFIAYRLEVFSVITIGTILLLIIQLLVYLNIIKKAPLI